MISVTANVGAKSDILEDIKKYIMPLPKFCHIVSLNPENAIIALKRKEFEKVMMTAQISIADGIGIVLAARILGIAVGRRITGVDLMSKLIHMAGIMRLRVLLIGGNPNLALRLTQCYSKQYPEAKFKGMQGIENIKKPKKSEEDVIFSIVAEYKPQLVFVAFGSPWQELWIDRHKKEFEKSVCMGVGQGFDVAGGLVRRAPGWMRIIGLEWLYRLMSQPWRWKRQLRLVEFSWLVLQAKAPSFFEAS